MMEVLKNLMNDLSKHHKGKPPGQSESRNLYTEIKDRYFLYDLFQCVAQASCLDEKNSRLLTITDILSHFPKYWVLESLQNNEKQRLHLDLKLSETLECMKVPCFQDKEHYTFTAEDFKNVAENTEIILQLLSKLLQKLMECIQEEHVLKFTYSIAVAVFIFAAEHLESNLWTSKQTNASAKYVMDILLKIFNVQNVGKLLQVNLTWGDGLPTLENVFLHQLLKTILPKLSRDIWKKCPGVQFVFSWCLYQTKFPHLGEQLAKVLPPSLLFVDDYMTENKITGVKCLHHIVENVSNEELRWYGRADVVYEALKHQLFSREAQILRIIIPAVIAILKVVEKSPESLRTSQERTVNKYDDVFQQILRDAEGENLLVLRRIYTQHLPTFVDIMGITAVRHLKRIIQVVGNYLEIYDGPSEEARFNMLKLLKSMIKTTWPRIPCYTCEIIKMLVKMLCDLEMDQTLTPKKVVDKLIKEIEDCLMLVKKVDDDNVLNYLICLESTDIPEGCKATIHKLIEIEIVGNIS